MPLQSILIAHVCTQIKTVPGENPLETFKWYFWSWFEKRSGCLTNIVIVCIEQIIFTASLNYWDFVCGIAWPDRKFLFLVISLHAAQVVFIYFRVITVIADRGSICFAFLFHNIDLFFLFQSLSSWPISGIISLS